MAPKSHSVYYRSCRSDIIRLIPEHCRHILDVGCGEGVTGGRVKELCPEARVVGIERNPDAASRAKEVLDRVLLGDVEAVDAGADGERFDCILFGDVLEHLVDPWGVLRRYSTYLDEKGCVVISIPNVQYYQIILDLALGNWSYRDRGILDRSHLRFFTYREMLNLLAQAGLKVKRVEQNVRLREHTRSGSEYARTIVRILPFLGRYLTFQYVVLAVSETGMRA